ncbi:dephospho-CoA kinase [Bermanella marisrubri]|uniref:Dephospho-CoA kinase n=1 Tax=Bermanella marisrubri TaxID=207949 RepID=Q1MZP6_9GAMM|nr:dephospho-CoA kinase [Bermanella marisrubri]EAT11511.1 dephospho-CoA kinase [Oceanobacter sp. RED65] [Bermanella marisrubri]
MSSFVVGVTGGIGSGKSAATAHFETLGISVVDADIVSRQVVAKGTHALETIVEHFGEHVILDTGELNRAALRKIVFESPDERIWLEHLTHPLIREAIITALTSADSPYAILASPLLFESDQYKMVNRTLVIDVPEALQLKRTCKRDDNSEQQVRAIMAVQMSRQDRVSKADDVIQNDQDLAYLHSQVELLHTQYLALAKQS